MLNLIIAILASVSVSIFLKIARRLKIDIAQAIAMNYLMALGLTYFILHPNFDNKPIGAVFTQSQNSVIFLVLGLLLPTVFLIMSKAVEIVGIVRSDAAQRLSLFLPIIAAFVIFGEVLTTYKVLSLIVAFVALFCLVYKNNNQSVLTQNNNIKSGTSKHGWFVLILVWLGYGLIDIMFKQMAKLGGQSVMTLFISFCLAACVMFIYLLVKRTHWTGRSMLGGLILGCLNFINIYFYIRAHQSFGSDPTIVFTGMNIGVICLGAVVGLFAFREKVNKINWLGIALGIIAIVALYNLK